MARCYARDSSALRAAAATGGWSDIPDVSTGELVWALHHAGFQARLAGPDHMLLLRDGHEVAYVPLKDRLHPGIVMALLRTVGLSLDDVQEYIAAAHETEL